MLATSDTKLDLIARLQQLPMRHWWLAWAVLGASLAFGTGTAYWFYRQAELDANSKFQVVALNMTHSLESRIRANTDLLYALRGLFRSSEKVTRDDFHEVAQAISLGERHPALTNISYSIRVARDQKVAFERAVRAETSPLLAGLPEFSIMPAGDRPAYEVLTYIEPMGKKNVLAWGLDVIADPVRRAAAERSRDSGQVSTSTGVALVQDGKSGAPSLLLRLAVYRGGSVPQTIEERRRLYVGTVRSVVRIGEMVEAALPDTILTGARLRILNQSDPTRPWLFDSQARDGAVPSPSFPAYAVMHHLAAGDQMWRVEITPLVDPLDAVAKLAVAGLSIASLAISVLLFWLVRTVATSDSRAAELAKSNARLKVLSESNRVAAAVFENAAEGVMVTDARLQIESVNPAFEQITGYRAAETVGRTPRMLFSGKHEESFFHQLHEMVDDTGHWRGEIWNRRRNGELYPQETSINVLRDADGRISHYASVFSDNTTRNQMETRLREMSSMDALTGIANRRTFDETLAREWARALREHRPPVPAHDGHRSFQGIQRP